ncbi:MAG TPA: lysylphosphatidylglycerol synthase transmembrane domain-containing protein [Kofleriaceae bacterium]|nr:lysylphosphatidylglycerol synthase transmembrane domain-containing protein [Kofleriaceae bacterium]
MNRRISLTLRILTILVIAACLWWFMHSMDFAALGRALRSAKLWPLILAAALNFVCLWGKAVCWRVMFAPRHKVPVFRLFRYTIATFAASAITPARAGEVLRVWTLKRRDGVPPEDTVAVAVAEKLLDGISMLLIVAPVPWLLPGLPGWVIGSLVGCAAIAITAFIALFIAVGRVGPVSPADEGKIKALFRRFITGMHVLRSPKRLLAALCVLLLVWATDLGEVVAVLHAVDVHLPIAAGLLILFTLNLAITLPSTPAQVGALELGALVSLKFLHVPDEPALAFALLYHAAQIFPLLAAGLLFELRLVLGRDDDALPKAGSLPGALVVPGSGATRVPAAPEPTATATAPSTIPPSAGVSHS